MTACIDAVTRRSYIWQCFFYTIWFILCIFWYIFDAVALQYSCAELVQCNTGVTYQLSTKYSIPAEILRPSSGIPTAEGWRRRRCEQKNKRGKWVGMWARLKASLFKLPLPTIFLQYPVNLSQDGWNLIAYDHNKGNM